MTHNLTQLKKNIALLGEPKLHESGWMMVETVARDLLTTEVVLECVCDTLRVEKSEVITSPKRGRDLSDARWLYIYFSKVLTTASDNEIARLLNQHHCAIDAGLTKVVDQLSSEVVSLSEKYNLVIDALKQLQRGVVITDNNKMAVA